MDTGCTHARWLLFVSGADRAPLLDCDISLRRPLCRLPPPHPSTPTSSICRSHVACICSIDGAHGGKDGARTHTHRKQRAQTRLAARRIRRSLCLGLSLSPPRGGSSARRICPYLRRTILPCNHCHWIACARLWQPEWLPLHQRRSQRRPQQRRRRRQCRRSSDAERMGSSSPFLCC